jgi:hypothetical protein
MAAQHVPSTGEAIVARRIVLFGAAFLLQACTISQNVMPVPAGASVNDCATVSTYIGRWSWDLTIYMSYARILVFHDSNQSGEAVYDATKGGGRLDKFVDAEPKIRELVEQLFPVKGSGN